MTEAQIHYCQTVERITRGDEDAKDDLYYGAKEVIAEDPENSKVVRPFWIFIIN